MTVNIESIYNTIDKNNLKKQNSNDKILSMSKGWEAMQKILFVSHCILNKAAKVEQDESELKEEYELRSRLLEEIVRQDVQVIQLPCPEFVMYGSRRCGHVKDQFAHSFYRDTCRKLFRPVLMQIEEYAGNLERFELVGIVSVEGSPSCGRSLTCRGDWGGELSDLEKVKRLTMEQEMGVFMEEISSMLRESHIRLPILTMQETVAYLCGGENGKE